MIHTGDCIEVMAGMPADSVDAVVTDPPYSLAFMSKHWDAHPTPSAFMEWCEAWGREALRVTKPGGYLLACGGTRTHHRLVCGLEDAGWIIRDELTWVYASGFPKGKANLKPAHEPIVLARKPGPLRALNIDRSRIGVPTVDPATSRGGLGSRNGDSTPGNGLWHADDPLLHNPDTVLRAWSAAQPEADSAPLASALADAFVGRGLLDSRGGYPSCRRCDDGLARISEAADRDDSPLRPDVPAAPPVREWSASRIREYQCADHRATWDELARLVEVGDTLAYGNATTPDIQQGRWPSNLLLSDPELFDVANPGVVGSGAVSDSGEPHFLRRGGLGYGSTAEGENVDGVLYGDSGGYSRFFIVPKADRADREPVLRGQLEPGMVGGRNRADGRQWDIPGSTLANGKPKRENTHATVKPTDLMRHLVRLVTPPGGTVLDCFLGSGSTAIACELEGFPWIGIEQDAGYVAIAEARLNGVQRGMGLDVPAPTKAPPKTHPDLAKHQPKQRNQELIWKSYLSAEEPA